MAPYNALYDRPATLELLGDVTGRDVLDAACGPGLYIEELTRRGARVVGCDASSAMVELARSRVGAAAELRAHSLEAPLDWLADASMDVVLCALALHYVTDRELFLREAHRVLRPDGSLVISTHHPTWDWLRLGGSYFDVRTVTETWSTGWDVSTWRLPLSQLTDEFRRSGFVIERLTEPRPVAAMAQSHPDDYAKLTKEPAFIGFRLLKSPLTR